MSYIFLVLILFITIIVYFRVAEHFNIIDKPNHRSSHSYITLRGGGVVFWVAALLYFIQHIEISGLFFTGITLISLVSFWDDIRSLPNTLRISVHFLAISLIFYNLNVFNMLPIWAVIITYIFAIGIINAYNFMDGINGITGLYTIIVLGSLWTVNQFIQPFINMDLIIYPIMASVVFLFFNFRKRAKCFAGDIGSIAIAFWIIYILLTLILFTSSPIWLLFLAVYGTDAVGTILHRILLKQNIFEAHRMHFYQVLSNEWAISHRNVSFIYAAIQLIVSAVTLQFYNKMPIYLLYLIIVIPLILIYSLKFYLIEKKRLVNRSNLGSSL